MVGRLDGVALLRQAQLLAAGAPSEPLLALVMSEVVGPASGWSRPWTDLVVSLRSSDQPDVRALAIGTVTVPE